VKEKNKQLTLKERYHIYGLIEAGNTKSAIAKKIGVPRSTITYEMKRCNGPGNYDPEKAEKDADFKKRNSHKRSKITYEMKEIIIEKLENEQWSPEEIYGWCKMNGIDMVSHQTIYEFVRLDEENGGKLYKHLRRGHRKIKKHGSLETRGQIKNRTLIEERPAIVDLKVRTGDLEGDTIVGANHKGVMVTINDRKSKSVLIAKSPSKNAKIVADVIIKLLKPFAQNLHTLTLDNGKEFADHERISQVLGIKIFFAHPYSSWERGLNENSNGLIRQYWPKGTSFETITDREIQDVMYKLNTRPRKTLGFASPAAAFDRGLSR
jgi:Transposase and inactivated derivatives, IS30 family